MKNTIAWIVAAVLLVGLIAGAGIVYDNYMEENRPSNIVIIGGKGEQTTASQNSSSTESVGESEEVTSEKEPVQSGKPDGEHTHESAGSTENGGNDVTEKDPAVNTEKDPAVNTEKVPAETTEKKPEITTEKKPEITTEKETEPEYVSPYLAFDFTVYDIDGNPVKLSDFRGKPIVLNFWARGCIYCVQEMPDFQKAYEKYGDEVVFLMVCHTGFNNTTPQYEQKLLDNNGYTFPAYYDTNHEAVAAYGVNALPQTWFIDRAFDRYTMIPGMATAEDLEYCIKLILQ